MTIIPRIFPHSYNLQSDMQEHLTFISDLPNNTFFFLSVDWNVCNEELRQVSDV